MLGPNKWRLLTIVAGILLAHAIDSPNRSARRLNQPSSQQKRSSLASLSLHTPTSPTSTHLGLTIEKVEPVWNSYKNSNNFSERRLARNLYTPFKWFSNNDDVRFIERHQKTGHRNKILDQHTTFGAFRYASPSNSLNTAGRRSDVDVPFALEYTNTTLSNPLHEDDVVTTSKPATLQVIKRHKYRYIPINNSNQIVTPNKKSDFPIETSTKTQDQEIRSRTDLNFYPDDQDAIQINQNTQIIGEHSTESSGGIPQALALESSVRSQVSSIAAYSSQKYEAPTKLSAHLTELQGRRSGLTFMQQTPHIDPPYVPQSYQEDDPSHPNFQGPYSEELSPAEPTEIRTARGAHYENYPHRSTMVQFPGPSTNHKAKPFHDDVTKFGDIDGPITSMQQRQYNDYFDGLRTYDNIYYSDDYRRPRQYYSSTQKYTEYSGLPLRSRLIVPYKSSRTPRVIFPSNDNLPTGLYNGENYSNNDNVVFR